MDVTVRGSAAMRSSVGNGRYKLIPIAPTVFWGPMAYAVMGGLVVATLLTLVFLLACLIGVRWIKKGAPPTP